MEDGGKRYGARQAVPDRLYVRVLVFFLRWVCRLALAWQERRR